MYHNSLARPLRDTCPPKKELTPWSCALLEKPPVSCSSAQEFPNILRNPKIRICVHKSPQLVPILSQMNPVYITSPYFSKIHSIILPPMSRSSLRSLSFWLFHHSSSPHACYIPCPAHTPRPTKRITNLKYTIPYLL
jgi:hypothetical protein